MAQQVFDKSWPLGKNGASELIPGGAILQTRDGKDEPITLSASFQLGEGGLFLPTDKDNPLEVRVRELEKLIGEIAANPTANTVQARLKALADRLGEAVASPSEHTLLARLAALEEDLGEIKAALESGDAKVTLTGHVAQDSYEGSGDGVYTLSNPMTGLVITNDGNVSLRVAVSSNVKSDIEVPGQSSMWELGTISGGTGEPSPATNRIRTINPFPIPPNEIIDFSWTHVTNKTILIFQYDSEGNYLGRPFSEFQLSPFRFISHPDASTAKLVMANTSTPNIIDSGTFTMNSLWSFTVLPDEVFNADFDPFQFALVFGSSSYRLYGRR